jgi:hypothetical protein
MKKAGSLPTRRVRITKPVAAVAYRAKLQPFDSVKFLDMAALSRARRAVVEIGTVETPKGSMTVVAHIRNGSIVGLAPKGCDGCFPRKGKKPAASKLKEMVKALDRAGLAGLGGPRLPIKIEPTATPARLALRSIIIIDIDIHWFDICVTWISTDGSICIFCLFGPFVCVDTISGAG